MIYVYRRYIFGWSRSNIHRICENIMQQHKMPQEKNMFCYCCTNTTCSTCVSASTENNFYFIHSYRKGKFNIMYILCTILYIPSKKILYVGKWIFLFCVKSVTSIGDFLQHCYNSLWHKPSIFSTSMRNSMEVELYIMK